VWYTTTLWKTLFLSMGKALPLFDAASVKLFSVKVGRS
jgi:hypothetical protein